jgi:hypothetical protein
MAALARIENDGNDLSYWYPQTGTQSPQYLNLRAIFVPSPTQKIHPVGKGLISGLLVEPAAGAFLVGAETLAAGPWGIPVTAITWGAGTYITMCWWNLVRTPTE